METINDAYTETKDALISGKIDPNNYLDNLKRVRKDLIKLKGFLNSSYAEITESLAAIRVLSKQSPIMGYVLRKLSSHRYGKDFKDKRATELNNINNEINKAETEGQDRINNVLHKNKKYP